MAGFAGLHPEFARRLQALFEAVPGLRITSGYRSYQEQAALWEKYGRNPRRVAPPGRSRHNFGLAADISGPPAAMARARELAPRFGLHFPMSWEPWHIEPLDVDRLKAGGGMAGFGGDTFVIMQQAAPRPRIRLPGVSPLGEARSQEEAVLALARDIGLL